MAISGFSIAISDVTVGDNVTLRNAFVANLNAEWTVGAATTINSGGLDEYTFYVLRHDTGPCILVMHNEGGANANATTNLPAAYRSGNQYSDTFDDTLIFALDPGTGTSTFYEKAYTDGANPSVSAFWDDCQPTTRAFSISLWKDASTGIELACMFDDDPAVAAMAFVTANTDAGFTNSRSAILLGDVLERGTLPASVERAPYVGLFGFEGESDAAGNDLSAYQQDLLENGERIEASISNYPLLFGADPVNDIPAGADPDPSTTDYHTQTWPVRSENGTDPAIVGRLKKQYLLACKENAFSPGDIVTRNGSSDEYYCVMDQILIMWNSTDVAAFP